MFISTSRHWLRLVIGIAIPGVLLSALIVLLMERGLAWYGWGSLIVAVIWFGWALVQALLDLREMSLRQGRSTKRSEGDTKAVAPPANAISRGDSTGEESGAPTLVSLVYLLDDAREPTMASVRRLLEVALGRPFDETDADSPGFITRFEAAEVEPVQRFFFRTDEGSFCLLACPDPYIEDPVEFARRTIRDKRLRRAVESHAAWISVDYADSTEGLSPERKRDLYFVAGKVAAALAGPDCLAVYCPELQRCNEFDLDMMERLREDDPRRIFTEPTHEPIIEISEDNPRMQAAVAEAIERWPEFVEAFEKQGGADDLNFIAKAEFFQVDADQRRNTEFMWINVTQVTATSMEGILMNEPHELPDYHKGQQVTVQIEHLNDWIFPNPDGTPVGGFTLSILSDDGE